MDPELALLPWPALLWLPMLLWSLELPVLL
jgi:hypothetical protein